MIIQLTSIQHPLCIRGHMLQGRVLIHLTLRTTPGGWYYFTDEESEAQSGSVTCPRSHSCWVGGIYFKPRLPLKRMHLSNAFKFHLRCI